MRSPRHDGLSRAFDLAPWSYYLDFVLVPVAVIGLIWLQSSMILIGLGLAGWTLAEYWIHRLVFHGHTRFEPMHHMHHVLPKDLIGVASWVTFAAFACVWLLAGAAFTAGLMLGYLAYCAIHVRFHHHRTDAKLSRYVAFMNVHHVAHHRGGKGNFGVTSPIWDIVFNTYRSK